jgi:hypothetical protein
MTETFTIDGPQIQKGTTDSARRRAFAARLEHELRRNKISPQRAARHAGVTQTELYFWRAGITLPNDDAYSKLACLLGCFEPWLRTGKGPAHSANATLRE